MARAFKECSQERMGSLVQVPVTHSILGIPRIFWHQYFIRYVFFKYSLLVCNLSSHSLGSVSHRAEFLVLMLSNLLIFPLMDFGFGIVSNKSPPKPGSPRFSPMLSYRNFIGPHLTFISLLHFEWFFFFFCMSVSRFIAVYVDIQLFYHHLLKGRSCLHWIAFIVVLKISQVYFNSQTSSLWASAIHQL